ncbi:hypothetical protein D515_00790 [Grimontia indica]|uniref:Uncharacterized protein n=1 Tax=Grimontia indica TaxID=1056512 RepID=R1IY08_9GAMM|nr:hypothetical protein D515_00790 [Grimontia indica]
MPCFCYRIAANIFVFTRILGMRIEGITASKFTILTNM